MSEAKEKAKELFNKYCYAIRTEETDSGYFTNIIYAKQCALIAVDELIESHLVLTTTHDLKPSIRCKRYWQEVKKELEKL